MVALQFVEMTVPAIAGVSEHHPQSSSCEFDFEMSAWGAVFPLPAHGTMSSCLVTVKTRS